MCSLSLRLLVSFCRAFTATPKCAVTGQYDIVVDNLLAFHGVLQATESVSRRADKPSTRFPPLFSVDIEYLDCGHQLLGNIPSLLINAPPNSDDRSPPSASVPGPWEQSWAPPASPPRF